MLFRYTRKTFARELLFLCIGAAWVIPFYLLVVVSLKSTQAYYSTGSAAPPPHLHWGNFSQAWQGAGGISLGAGLLHSAIITGGSVIGVVLVGSLAAYAIARRETPMGTALYVAFLLGTILPFQLGTISAYALLRYLHLLNTYPGMILLYTALLMPLSVFLFTGFVRSLPKDYEEAAFLDGSSRLRTFFRVTMPLLFPVTLTVAVISAVIVWNDFFTQLIFLAGSSLETIPVVVYGYVGEYSAQWNVIFAVLLISMAPILVFYFLAQRQLMRGFTGGLKG